ASTNNGAVQNIVEELPKQEEISNEFIESLIEADYFYENSNTKFKEEFPEIDGKKKREITSEMLGDENWGTFSKEGGAKSKINKLKKTSQNEIERKEDKLHQKYEGMKIRGQLQKKAELNQK